MVAESAYTDPNDVCYVQLLRYKEVCVNACVCVPVKVQPLLTGCNVGLLHNNTDHPSCVPLCIGGYY